MVTLRAMANQKASQSALDIIIIGAGLSGLAAAISCAIAGHNVLVLESAKELAEVGIDEHILEHKSTKLIHQPDRRRTSDHA